MNNLKLFENLNDRQNIASAYSRMCESVEQNQTALEFIESNYPGISDENIGKLDSIVCDYIGADDSNGLFTFTMSDVDVAYHTENNGIGPYEYWGHTEYDHGENVTVIDDYADDIDDTTPEGSKLVFADDQDSIVDRIRDYANGFDKDDIPSKFSTSIDYELVVTNPVAFKSFIERIADENGIPLNDDITANQGSHEMDGDDGSEMDESIENFDETDYERDYELVDKKNQIDRIKRIAYSASNLDSKLRKIRMNLYDPETVSRLLDEAIAVSESLTIEANTARNIAEVS